jgi:hypothetical protein
MVYDADAYRISFHHFSGFINPIRDLRSDLRCLDDDVKHGMSVRKAGRARLNLLSSFRSDSRDYVHRLTHELVIITTSKGG